MRKFCIRQFPLRLHLPQNLIASLYRSVGILEGRIEDWSAKKSCEKCSFFNAQRICAPLKKMVRRILDTGCCRPEICSIHINCEQFLLRKAPPDMPTQPKIVQLIPS